MKKVITTMACLTIALLPNMAIVGGSIGGVWGAAIGFAVVGVIALAVKM